MEHLEIELDVFNQLIFFTKMQRQFIKGIVFSKICAR